MEGRSSTAGLVSFLLCFLAFSVSINSKVAAVDFIRANQSLEDGSTIVSAGGHFELGFSTAGSKGNLVILNASDNIVWSSKSSTSVENPETSVIMQLLDSGNLVVRYETDGAPENYLWQSLIYLGMLIYQCLDGFEPKVRKQWDVADWSSGCVRKVQMTCTDGDGFLLHPGLKLPDTQHSWFNRNMSLEECKRLCLKNCSCTAYANTDIRGSGSGCLLWFDELTDIREFNENGQDLYVRKALSKFTAPVLVNKNYFVAKHEASKEKSKVQYIISPILLTATMIVGLCLWVIWKKKQRLQEIARLNFENDGENGNIDGDLELPLFDFRTFANATNGFSTNSKLGEGGFGPVYKAWRSYTNGNLFELVDEIIAQCSQENRFEIFGAIQIGESRCKFMMQFMINNAGGNVSSRNLDINNVVCHELDMNFGVSADGIGTENESSIVNMENDDTKDLRLDCSRARTE
ncbi:G-type lectin S-receptor-like serine/threonine-protein kinase SD1-1 [Apium graveolens]|uniref:G-type lectin S-receptor-like serine/threonine-protein kinase SD1-1 n=1 Tax=Apium graveolens TaxID=4045 RepID=UPI003D794061